MSGPVPRKLLIRAIGPSLTPFGFNGALLDPVLTLTTAAGTGIRSNDNWGTSANQAEIVAIASRVAAFPLDAASKDAVVLATLAPGNYTALVGGAGDATGVASVEVYEVP